MKGRYALVILAMFAGALSPAAGAETGRVPRPSIVIEKGDKCVEDTAVMRREHMNLLKHQRDRTVRQGIRTTQYSLNNCIDCHASRTTNSVIGSDGNFCQSCHAYAAVKLDCFECHASKPAAAAAREGPVADRSGASRLDKAGALQ